MNDNKIMKEEMAKHLEKAFLLICIVCAFCVIALIVAATYYIIIGRIVLFDSVLECTFKCVVTPLIISFGICGIYIMIKGIRSWLDK